MFSRFLSNYSLGEKYTIVDELNWRQICFVVFVANIYGMPRFGRKREKMLETIAIVMIVLWLVGLVSSYTMGGLIHILLVIAVVSVLVRVIQGRRL